MHVSRETTSLRLIADTYVLTFPPDRPYIYLDDSTGTRVADLFALSSVHSSGGRDDATQIETWRVDEKAREMVFTLKAGSSIWDGKRCRLRCGARRFVYEIEVEGKGQLDEVEYFGGYSSALPRWGSGRFWSGGRFRQGFTPEPNTAEAQYFPPGQGAVIDLIGGPLPGKGHWFFTPPPFCYAFQGPNDWVGLGVEAAAGANRFTEYRYLTQLSGFALALSYDGHTRVDGQYVLPGIGFDFGTSEWEVLQSHAEALRADGMAPAPEPGAGRHPVPAWWREPIFCGWGSQVGLALDRIRHAAREPAPREHTEQGPATPAAPPAPAYSTQANYEDFLAALEAHGVEPGTVVLDDKWQATYGDNRADAAKWPDLRGFVDAQHGLGRKVLLWLKAWDPEGLPDEECILNAAGVRLALDPSNPATERRLRASVHRMLSAEGYDADGFKIDFTARIPSGPGIRLHADTWGLELMKLYLGIIYDEAKRAKGDALVMTHTPHPYLADVVDMIRLNDTLDLNLLDVSPIGLDLFEIMSLRARVAHIACPDVLIDTDNWPVRDRATWREYVRRQPELGIPSLYFTDRVDLTGEPLEEEDYRLVRETWAAHRAELLGPPPAL